MNNKDVGIMPEESAASVTAEANPAELSADPPEHAENEGGNDDTEKRELLDRIDRLEAELLKEQVKVKLLISGILPEKLEDGAAMAYGLCLAGKDTDAAASEIMEAYPHFRAVRRDIPQFSAESAGSGDGFSTIRKIFSSR